ncbi:hypothetical protein C8R42DRAFT_720852 [Lentinula raphanica]|nr:hypothetical protein C8R42DRAFT_720852 [Lentinula raphanica]
MICTDAASSHTPIQRISVANPGISSLSRTMSTSSASESSSIFTSGGTFTSSSTVPGLGYLSGKVIKRFGSAVVNGVDAILIRRRLAQIEDSLGPTSDGIVETPGVVQSLYSDLLELSRPVYSFTIRTRAIRVIISKVGAMDFQDLARAMIDWPLPESYDLLKVMMACLRQELSYSETKSVNTDSESEKSARLDLFYAAGNEAYKSQLPFRLSDGVPRRSFAAVFLLFIAFTVALSSKPSFSRLVLESGLLSLIKDIYPNITSTTLERQSYLFPAYLAVEALLESLDPEVDSVYITQLKNMLDDESSQQDTLTPIRLAISQHDLPALKSWESLIYYFGALGLDPRWERSFSR